MRIKFLLVAIMVYLSGCTDQGDVNRNTPHPMVGQVLWAEPTQNNENTDTRIISVKLVRDICNIITLDVTYYNKGDLPGYLRLSPNAGIPGQRWPMLPKMKQGLRTMQIQNGFQREAEQAKSHELTVAIEHIVDNKWSGYIDRRAIGFEKHWNNDCL